jgi:hypothetical protein
MISASDSVVRVAPDRLKPLESAGAGNPPRIRYVLYAARIANLLSEDVLLAPGTASIISLPHQIRALRRAVSHERIRFLLADEVGLGKTIEAGLIMRDLKVRGLVPARSSSHQRAWSRNGWQKCKPTSPRNSASSRRPNFPPIAASPAVRTSGDPSTR